MQDHRPVPTFPIRLIWNWLLLSTPDQAPAYSHWLPESILYDALLWLKSRRCMCFYEIHIEYKKYSKAIVMVNKLTYHYCIGVAGNVFQAWAIKVSLPEQLLCSVKAKIFNFTSDRKKKIPNLTRDRSQATWCVSRTFWHHGHLLVLVNEYFYSTQIPPQVFQCPSIDHTRKTTA